MEVQMTKIKFVTVLLFLSCVPVFGQVSSGIDGKWLGALDVSGVKQRLLLKVEKAGDGYSAKFDSVDQGVANLPIDSITLSGNTMKFSAAQFGITYEGTLNEKNDEISGTFRQGSGSTPFVFKRTAEKIEVATRPQDPKGPLPYSEVNVSYKNTIDNVKLAGTLTLPKRDGKYPAVILISGSGAQNRDSLVAGHRPFLILADHLTRNGIAVLRVDDRGAGSSELGSLSATSENFMFDVLAGVDFLKSRPDIDPKKIGLIGHSEGGMIAPMAASRSRDIAFIVMLAGLGQTGEDIIYTQTELLGKASGGDPNILKHTIALSRLANAVVKTETDSKRIEEKINEAVIAYSKTVSEDQKNAFNAAAANAKAGMSMYTMPWYKYFISFDPAPVLKKVSVPVLALNGEFDLQVASKENLDLITAALKAGRNKDFTVKSFPKLNHLFQTSKTGLISEYERIDETISPVVLNTISEWITKRTAGAKN